MIRLSGKFFALMATVALASCGVEDDQQKSGLSSGGVSGPCPTGLDWVYPAPSPTSKEVYLYAKNRLNQKVGSGQCAALASAAVSAAGGISYSRLGPTGLDADYVWGNLIATSTPSSKTISGVRAGDIVQYRNVKTRYATGPNSYLTTSASHHTSIVSAVSRDGRHVCVLQQNSPRDNFRVTYVYLSLGGLQEGKLSFYRVKR